jgi:hypothetical protein
MKNVAFHYIYRDAANYKNFHAEIFKNPSGMNIDDTRLLIKQKFISEEYFYAAEIQVPDLHFGSWDEEFDHEFHEFAAIEYTDEPPNTLLNLGEFVTLIKNTNWI